MKKKILSQPQQRYWPIFDLKHCGKRRIEFPVDGPQHNSSRQRRERDVKSLSALPTDLKSHIFGALPIRDLLMLRSVSKIFGSEIQKDNTLWCDVLTRINHAFTDRLDDDEKEDLEEHSKCAAFAQFVGACGFLRWPALMAASPYLVLNDNNERNFGTRMRKISVEDLIRVLRRPAEFCPVDRSDPSRGLWDEFAKRTASYRDLAQMEDRQDSCACDSIYEDTIFSEMKSIHEMRTICSQTRVSNRAILDYLWTSFSEKGVARINEIVDVPVGMDPRLAFMKAVNLHPFYRRALLASLSTLKEIAAWADIRNPILLDEILDCLAYIFFNQQKNPAQEIVKNQLGDKLVDIYLDPSCRINRDQRFDFRCRTRDCLTLMNSLDIFDIRLFEIVPKVVNLGEKVILVDLLAHCSETQDFRERYVRGLSADILDSAADVICQWNEQSSDSSIQLFLNIFRCYPALLRKMNPGAVLKFSNRVEDVNRFHNKHPFCGYNSKEAHQRCKDLLEILRPSPVPPVEAHETPESKQEDKQFQNS